MGKDAKNPITTAECDPDMRVTELMRVAVGNDFEYLFLLCEASTFADLFQRDAKGRTALDWARQRNNPNAVDIISEAMSKALCKARMDSTTDVENIKNITREGNLRNQQLLWEALDDRDADRALKLLLANDIFRESVAELDDEVYFVDYRSHQGDTALIRAAGYGMKDVVIELLGMGAELEAANKYGHNALIWACMCGSAEVVRVLLEKKANLNHQALDGRTCLHYACEYGKSSVVGCIFDVLFERFSMYKTVTYPFTKFDSQRWIEYANIVTNFVMVKDNNGRTAMDLIPRVDARDWANEFDMESVQDESSNECTDEVMKGSFSASRSGLINPSKFNESFSALGQSRQTQNTHDTHYFSSFAESLSIQSSPSMATEIYAIHNVLKVVQDKVKSWQHSAQKEEDMEAPVKCWNGCGFVTKFESMTSHVRENCPFKPSICSQCNEVFKLKDIQHHMTRECPKRNLACPNAVVGCKDLVKADYMSTHLSLRCQYRLAYCRLHCNTQVPVCMLDDHEKTHCKKRRIHCHQCQELVPSEKMPYHLKNDCQCRKVKCSKGCHDWFFVKDIEYHEEFVCERPCKWECGERIGPLEKRNYHEQMQCPNRPVLCSKDCGISGLTARNKEDHEKHYCKYIQVKCPHYCGEIMYRSQLSKHLEPWHGSCPERPVRCPSNVVGWRIMVNMEEGIVIKYSRIDRSEAEQQQELQDSADDENDSSAGGSSTPQPDRGDLSWCADGMDMLYVRFSTRHAWVPFWTSEIIPISWQMKGMKSANDDASLNQGMYQCGWVVYSQLNDHLAHHCCNREVLVGGINPKTEMTYGKATVMSEEAPDTSTTDVDPNKTRMSGIATLMDSMKSFDGQIVSAKNSVPLAEKRHQINSFLIDEESVVNCEYCSVEVKTEELAWHVKHNCSHILLRCKFGCGQKLMRRQLEVHMAEECPKRLVNCKACDEEMWADELDDHSSNSCRFRPVECRYACGASGLTAHSEVEHAEKTCDKRIHTCECGAKYPFFQRSDHLITDCPKRKGLCPQGCKEMISRDVLDEHMELYCANKDVFQNKPVNCPIKCGARMLRKDILEHVTYKCPYRITECPFKCGNTFKNDKLNLHLRVCANRPIQCEKGMPTCDFPLCQWLYKDGTVSGGAIAFSNDEPDSESKLIESGSTVSRLTEQSGGNAVYLGSGPIIPRNRPEARASGKFVFPDESSGKLIKQGNLASDDESSASFLSKADDENLSHARSSTSCSVNNGKVEFLDELRLYSCPHHGRNLLMYAVRYDELHLAKWIIQKTRGDDLDIQDRFGDTALTLACRLQRNDIIDLLMHHGADVNMETYGGKTPLIEATKVNDRAVVEKLINAGATVLYKTVKHRKTAVDWAKYLKLELLVIYLELGAVTQTQIETIFHGISRGDTAFVVDLIEPGQFFDASNTQRFSKVIDDTMASLEESREIIGGYVDKLKEIAISYESTKVEFNRIDAIEKEEASKYEKLFSNCKDIREEISIRFEKYDKHVRNLCSFDLEEIQQMLRPIPIVRLTVLAYCLLFDVLEFSQSSYPTDEKCCQKWWRKAVSALSHPDVLVKMKNFPWVMLQSPHKRKLGEEVKRLYSMYLAEKKVEVERSRQARLLADEHGNDGDVKATATKSRSRGPTIDTSLETHIPKGFVDKTATSSGLDESDIDEDQDEEIPQELWDSDAEDAGGGHWEMGEWVPSPTTKANWWDKKAVKEYKEEKRRAKTSQLTTKEKKRATQVSIRIENRELVSQAAKVGSSLGVPNQDSSGSDLALDEIKMPFVCSMELLMSAVAFLVDDMDRLVLANRSLTEGKKHYDGVRKEADMRRQLHMTESARHKMVEAEMIAEQHRSSKYKERIEVFRERLRVAMLLNKVTASGHTAVSWAAAHGTFDIMESLLSHGATVGYNEELMHMSASIIQTTFRIFYYHSSFVKVKKEKIKESQSLEGHQDSVSTLSSAAMLNKEESEIVTASNSVEEFFQLRDKLGKLIFLINRKRRQFRFPIPEAAYNGHSHIVERIYHRNLAHFNFMGSWMMASPPPPRPKPHRRLQLTGSKYSFLELIDAGRSVLGAGCWIEQVGWVAADDPRNLFFEEKEDMVNILTEMQKKIDTFREGRNRVRLLNIEKKKLRAGKEKMTRAIVNADFKKCIEYASTDVCSIDFETDKGLTALIVAAEENIGGLYHSYIINTDGDPVLAVCYLLDRTEHAPGVNVENKFGVTALMHAASLGRQHCVEALLDRFASIDKQNFKGETALHIAAKTGNTRCAKLLIERGASLTIKNNDGMDAYALALDEGFTDVLAVISQFQNNFLGPVKVARGTVDERKSCPIGCGKFLLKHEVDEHLEVCVCRPVQCPYGCDDDSLLSREIEDHKAKDCVRRPYECPKCHEIMPLIDFETHRQRYCSHRLLECSLSCGERVPAREMAYHIKNCPYKIIACPDHCGERYPLAKRLDHARNHCAHRRVVCPLRCAALVVYKSLDIHVNEVCPCRPMVCKWCGETKLHKDWIMHEKHCEFRKVPCDAYCGEDVVWKDMQHHINNTCKNRFISCPLKCGYKAREVDMDNHLSHECDNRIMECPNKCMTSAGGVAEKVFMLSAKQVGIHLRVDCPERELRCGMCQQTLLAKNLPLHNKNDCEYRIVDCRCVGCMKKLPFNKRDDHEKNKCKFRLVICPAGCGLSIVQKKLDRHLDSKCDMLRVACVAGCGQVVQQGQMSDHLKHECSLRKTIAGGAPRKLLKSTTNSSSMGFELDESFRREDDDDEEFSLSNYSFKNSKSGSWRGLSSSDLLTKSSSYTSLPPI